jgi:hypothetical protein
LSGAAAGRRGGSGLKPSEGLALAVARVLAVHAGVPASSEAQARMKRGGERMWVCDAPQRGDGSTGRAAGVATVAGLPAGLRAIMRANAMTTGP